MHLHTPRWHSLLHTEAVCCGPLLPGYTPVQHVPIQNTRSGQGQGDTMQLREAVNVRHVRLPPVCRGFLFYSQLFFLYKKAYSKIMIKNIA